MTTEIEKKVSRIIQAYAENEHIPPDTENEFAHWLVDKRHKKEKEKALIALWNNSAYGNKAIRYKALKKIKIRLGHPVSMPLIGRWRVGAVAAAILLLIVAGGMWLHHLSTGDIKPPEPTVAVISIPDSIQQPVLPDTAKVVPNKSTVLPDDSKVQLAAHSSIVYDEGKDGTVYALLEGEASFDVKSRPNSTPFIVKTAKLEVRVHGTRFNVREYPGENYSTVTLEKGSVEVILPKSSVFMDPGYLLTYLHDSDEVLYDRLPQKSTPKEVSLLDFHRVDLRSILTRLADHYNLEFRMEEGNYLSDQITVRFEGNESAEDLMFILQNLSEGFNYTIQNNIVSIHPL